MHKAKLRLTRISDAELVQRVLAAKAGLTENAGQFAKAAELIAKLEAAFEPYASATQSVAEAKVELRARVGAKNARRKTMERVFRYVATLVESDARDRVELIYAAGMDATATPQRVLMPPVEDLTLPPGNEGELRVEWKPVRGRHVYEVQFCTDPTLSATTVWKIWRLITKSHCRLNRDLVSGQKVWVRVRAHGTNGPGAWSNVVWKRVP